jgi:large subunit ribosomal protein L34e
MVRGQYKSGTFRKLSRKTPGGRVSVQYKLRKPGKAHCYKCGTILQGVPNERPNKLKKMSKSMRRPERPFGGVLCSKCVRKHIVSKILSGSN